MSNNRDYVTGIWEYGKNAYLINSMAGTTFAASAARIITSRTLLWRMERIVIAICIIWLTFALLNFFPQGILWEESLKKGAEYAVYIDGKEIEGSKIKLEALSIQDYKIQINDEKKKFT